MKKSNMKMRLAASVLALSMLASTPAAVFAETYKTDKGEIKTTDWSEKAQKERENKTGSWPLSMKNRLVRVGFGDPVKTPDINYVGVYTNADGREVVRLTFNAFTVSANQWDKLLIRLPSELAEIFDQKNPQSGIYKGVNSYGNHDQMDMEWINNPLTGPKGAKVPLEPLAWDVAGGQNVYAVDLDQNGSMRDNAKLVIPIDLVLKEGKSIKDFKSDLLVQGRLTDKNFERVYMRHGEISNDYMQYTFSTIIPHENNYGIYSNKDLSNVGPTNPAATYNKFFSNVSSVKFNEKKGYLEVYIRQSKWDTGEGYALRQAVESDFFDLLDVREGMVGEVYLMSAGAKPYSATKEEPYEPTTKIQFAESDIYKDDKTKVGFIQIAGSEWDSSKEYKDGIVTKKSSNINSKDAILNGTSAQFNAGVYTVVRYFIKPTELKKLIKDNGLKSYTFRSSFLRQNESKYTTGNKTTGTSVFTFTNDKDRVFKRGDKVKLEFNQAQYNRVAATYVTRPEIIIGDDNYNINFINSVEYDRSGKEATWTVPFDLKIKAGEKVTIKSTEWDDNNRATELKITFKDLDSVTLTEKNKTVSYAPIEMLNSESLTGGALISTTARPNVDEIFTDSDKITGHSYYDGGEINIKYVDTNGKEVKQTISAAGATDLNPDKVDYSKILTKARYVNGQEVDAFPFDTTKPNNGGVVQGDKKFEEFKMPTLERDMPISVDNLDVLSSFIPSGDVVEQVQSKFHFDLNGEKSKTDLNVLDKIAPLSKEYKYDPETGKANDKYKASGFEGNDVKYADENNKTIEVDGRTYQNVANHDGLAYDLKKQDQKEAFLMRQMPTKDDINVPQGKRILGWTTKKLEDTDDKKVVDQFNELKDADKVIKTVEDWANVDNDETYIFDANSPIDKERTVYAVYGPIQSAVYNPEQKYDEANDKQYIEAIPEEEGKTLPEGATYKLVKKNADGTYTPVEGVTQTTKEDGTPVFDITGEDSPVKHGDEIYIETKETGKEPSYSKTPVKVDKQGPKFIGDGQGNDLVVTQDPYGYQITVAANAQDDSGILRVYIDDDKANGYYKEDASIQSGGFEAKLQNQEGEEKTVTVTAVDKFGNKTPATHTFMPVIKDIVLETMRPRAGKNFVTVTSAVGATIEVKLNGNVIGQQVLSQDTEKITLNTTLTKGNTLEITATLDGSTKTMKSKVR